MVGNYGRHGHREYAATLSSIGEFWFWDSMERYIRDFSNSCMHSPLKIGGYRVRGSYGNCLHVDKPNDIIQFDFLFLGKSTTDLKYGLLVKDEASYYRWPEP